MDEEYEKRKQAVEMALANLKLEGLVLNDFSKELTKKYVNGEITTEQMKEELDKYFSNLPGSPHCCIV